METYFRCPVCGESFTLKDWINEHTYKIRRWKRKVFHWKRCLHCGCKKMKKVKNQDLIKMNFNNDTENYHYQCKRCNCHYSKKTLKAA